MKIYSLVDYRKEVWKSKYCKFIMCAFILDLLAQVIFTYDFIAHCKSISNPHNVQKLAK